MYKVQFRGVTSSDRVPLDDVVYLNFDPRLSPVIRIRPHSSSAKHTDYRVVADRGVADLVADDPGESSIVVYLQEIR